MSTATTTKAGTGGVGNSLVAVTFNGNGKHYHYWVSDSWRVQPGDEIVIVTPSTGENVVTVASLPVPFTDGWTAKRAARFYRRGNRKNEPPMDESITLKVTGYTDAEMQGAIYDNHADIICESFAVPAHLIPKEKTMNITTETFVDSTNIKSLTDDQLFEKIMLAEAEVKRLKTIENKPEKLLEKIVGLQTGIDKLVKLIDSR